MIATRNIDNGNNKRLTFNNLYFSKQSLFQINSLQSLFKIIQGLKRFNV